MPELPLLPSAGGASSDGTDDLGLVADYWTLALGATDRPAADAPTGVALAIVVELIRRGAAAWTGDATPALALRSAAAAGALAPWYARLADSADVLHPLPARFVLFPLLPGVWEEVGDLLVACGVARREPRRLGRDRYGVVDLPAVRRRRCEILDALPREGVTDLPRAVVDLLLVGQVSETLGDLFAAPGMGLPEDRRAAVERAVAGNALLGPLEAVVAYARSRRLAQ